jgi:hypothetical protein
MFRVNNLCEDSDDNGDWPNTNTDTNTIAASASLFLVSRKRPREHKESSKNDAHAHHLSSEHIPGNRNDESTDEYSQKPSSSEIPSKALGRQSKVSLWEVRLSELAEYRSIHGHCNVPYNCNKKSKLATWVANQRSQYKLHQEGKASQITTFRIQELESVGFEWKLCLTAAWELRLSELADYRRTQGHCNVPCKYSKNTKLATWVGTQRSHYKLHLEGKASSMTNLRIQELNRLGFEWNRSGATWEDRLSELADYRKIHGHCNVPKRCRKNSKLGAWIGIQRKQYKSHREGKTSPMTNFRIQALESLGFEWSCFGATWEERLSELADYRNIQGHCNVPQHDSKNLKLATWIANQRMQYKLHLEGKTSYMTTFRIQELESLGFEWSCIGATWEGHLSELAEYRRIRGHCNVPYNFSKKSKLATWVANLRSQYKLHQEGKASSVTNLRIQALESLGFEWNRFGATWEDRLSELAEYRKIHGNCNVPYNYSENPKLVNWVANQRQQYNSNLNRKTSPMTTFRIQELERLGFEWKPSRCHRKRTPKKSIILDDDSTRVRERAVEVAPEHVQTTAQHQKDFSGRELPSNQIDVAFVSKESDWSGEVHLGYVPGRTEDI